MGTAQKRPTLEEVASRVSTEVYKMTQFFEALETAGFVHGNGHHMRQKVAAFAADLVRDRWNGEPGEDDAIVEVADDFKGKSLVATARKTLAEIYKRVMGESVDGSEGREMFRGEEE